MPKRDPKVRLLHLRDYARKAVAMVEGQVRADLEGDEKLRLALTHLVELVGEAAIATPDGVKLKETAMKAIVVYESFWGNTAAIARAIAEGIGPKSLAISTAEGTSTVVADADLIVAGAPIIAFRLPTDQARANLAASSGNAPKPPDLSHPSMRSWLDSLPAGSARFAAFETRVWWSPGSATGGIERGLERKGYRRLAKPQRFIVKGAYGPLRDGELERARGREEPLYYLAWAAGPPALAANRGSLCPISR